MGSAAEPEGDGELERRKDGEKGKYGGVRRCRKAVSQRGEKDTVGGKTERVYR